MHEMWFWNNTTLELPVLNKFIYFSLSRFFSSYDVTFFNCYLNLVGMEQCHKQGKPLLYPTRAREAKCYAI